MIHDLKRRCELISVLKYAKLIKILYREVKSMNPLFRFALKLMSSPKIDMQEDYVWIRKMQKAFSKTSSEDYHFLDEKIYAENQAHDIPIRIFYPENRKHEEHVIYIHGGGWALGNVDTYTSACVNLANHLNRVIYLVDYRKAPEHPYPAAFEDCLQVVKVLQKQAVEGKKKKWILMGDSAGGNLAAAVSLKLREENLELPYKQVLVYPLTFWDHSEDSPFESVQTNGYDYGLTMKKITEYMEMYVPDESQRKSPFVSPLMADDFTNQPDTLVLTAEFDPLRDEGEEYGRMLKQAGNHVEIRRILESVHGFMTYPPYVEPLSEAYKIMNEFLN